MAYSTLIIFPENSGSILKILLVDTQTCRAIMPSLPQDVVEFLLESS
jgi:hypothetical protein